MLIKVYNILGEVVAVLEDGIRPAGYHQTEWNPDRSSSGIYFYSILA